MTEQVVSSLLYETFCFIFLAGLHGTAWFIHFAFILIINPKHFIGQTVKMETANAGEIIIPLCIVIICARLHHLSPITCARSHRGVSKFPPPLSSSPELLDTNVRQMFSNIRASSRKNLSSRFVTRWDSNRPAQAQKLDRVMKLQT